MPVYYDSRGNSYALSERLGGGGEGTVYVCPNDLSLVAKIYHEPISEEKAEKLRWMADNQNERLLKVAAWIVDTLHDQPNGKTIGFLMPNVKAKEIHELYSLKSRRVYFPDATWQFLVHTAANLARAFYNLHKSEHIMGDINQGNCVVLADGTVKLIDCDSYSINTGARRYRCEVGVATHLAPELQGVELGDVERQNKHDNFGIAVIIFQLLFLGRHPFSGNFLGSEDKSLEDCIRERRFAYGDGAKDRWVKQPPGTLPLFAVSPRIALMFERAFLTEDRPEPQEWIEALEDLSNNLNQCAVHPGHHFFKDLKTCPWCEIETQTGLMLFPFTSEKQQGEEHFNIFTVENLIASLNIPTDLPMKMPPANQPAALMPPSPAIKIEKNAHAARIAKFAAAQFLMIVLLTAIFGIGFAFMWGVIVLIFSLVYVSNAHQIMKESAEYDLETARKEWNKLEKDWTAAGTRGQIEGNLSLIRKKIADYELFQQKSREQLKHLREEVFNYKLDLYLSDFKISESKIPGIKTKSLPKLADCGVKTAADVKAKYLYTTQGVDSAAAEQLLVWRENLERNFDYEPQDELPEAERRKFTTFLSEKRRHIEKEIEGLFVGLRSGASLIRQKQQQLTAQSETAAAKLQQAQSDVSAVSTNAPAFAVLVMTTFLTLGLSSALTGSSSSRTSSNYPPPAITNPPTAANPPKSNVVPPEIARGINLPDNLTDQQIAAMSVSERGDLANNLSNYASKSIDYYNTESKYRDVEPKMRLAARLSPDDAVILTQLGNVLYNLNNFPQALDALTKAQKLDSSNTATKSLLGMVYIRTDKYQDAVRIFTGLTASNPNQFEWQFNFGLAYKGLKKYSAALEKFTAAQKLSPKDVDTQNEIDFCNTKLGKANGTGNGIGSGSGTGSGTGSNIPPPPPPPPAKIK